MKKIKLFKPYVSWRSIFNVISVLINGQLAEGPQVKAFEEELGKFLGFEDIICLNSGSSALELAYELADIKEGDEVITPVLTAVMTNLPLIRRKAKVIFADTEKDLNISISDVLLKITPKTKAIVFVHFNGNSRGLDELSKICRERNIILIEDAAQAIGSDNIGKGDFICFSFQAIKTFTTGDGGALVCKDKNLSNRARKLKWFGLDRENRHISDIVEAGYKYHMNDITASIGRGNLKSIRKVVEHRKNLVNEYRRNGVDAYIWRAFVLTDKREVLQKYLKAAGIDSAVYDNRNDNYSVFGGKIKLKTMDEIENKYLLLPLHTGMSLSDVKNICNIINNFNQNFR